MHKNSNLSVAFCVSYTYDALGRPVTRGADRFGYNGRSEVVSALTDVVASYAYDAFGNTVTESGAMAGTFPFRFSTKYYDSESGLYYYGYRFYSPKLGRWLTRDPIEEAGGVNLYGFCGNDGVRKWDKLGRSIVVGKEAYESLVVWSAEVQYETTIMDMIHPMIPVMRKRAMFAAVETKLPGRAPAHRKRSPNCDTPWFNARKLTVYAVPRNGFTAVGTEGVFDGAGNLRFEPIIAIVPSGGSSLDYWQDTWSDVSLLWKYDGKYADSTYRKKHVDCFFGNKTSGTWTVFRAIKVYDDERTIIPLESWTFTLEANPEPKASPKEEMRNDD